MKEILTLIFKKLTPADFFNINKPRGTEKGGGGQSYIDVSTKDVPLDVWKTFFDQYQHKNAPSGPLWNVEIKSIGNLGSQNVAIGLRRRASVNIRSQKLFSQQSNRIYAWHPDYSNFPRPPLDMSSAEDPRVIRLSANLTVFLVKTVDYEHWAGWLTTEEINRCVALNPRFEAILSNVAGCLVFNKTLKLDETNQNQPFVFSEVPAPVVSPESIPVSDTKESVTTKGLKPNSKRKVYNSKAGKSESNIIKVLFSEDISSDEVKKKREFVELYRRNRKAVRKLKKLYRFCQITGGKFVFEKADGEPYLEVHHLVPLGDGGADNPSNLIVVSAHIHRMLHYSEIQGIELSMIKDDKLDFTINGKKYTVTWLPEHAHLVRGKNKDTNS